MNSKLFFLIILAVACLSGFASDAYAPSLPAIATTFNTHVNLAQLSLVIYMFGVASSILIYGTLSEGIGRKTPLVIGLSIMLCGGLVCMLSPNIETLIWGRLLQGIGAGACAGLWRAIFRDIYSGEQLAKMGAYFAIFVIFIIPAAPTLGGYLQQYFGWRATFLFINGYALFTLVAVLIAFKDTSKHHHTDRLKWSFIISTFGKLVTNRIFMGVTLCTFLSYGAFFSWFAVGPILLIHRIGISPVTFGWLSFIGCGSCLSLSAWLNGRMISKLGMPNMMRLGWSIMIFAGMLMLVGKFIWGVNLWSIFIPAILFYFGASFIWPSAFATAITPFGEIAGYAGSLYSFMQMAGGALIGSIAAGLPDTNQIPLAWVFIISSALAFIAYELIMKNVRGC